MSLHNAPKRRIYGMPCPHCHGPARVRTSELPHPLMKKLTYQCQNVACGHTFVGHLEITHTLSPSATPNPAIDLPLSKPAKTEPC